MRLRFDREKILRISNIEKCSFALHLLNSDFVSLLGNKPATEQMRDSQVMPCGSCSRDCLISNTNPLIFNRRGKSHAFINWDFSGRGKASHACHSSDLGSWKRRITSWDPAWAKEEFKASPSKTKICEGTCN